jgi:hypothetical protein
VKSFADWYNGEHLHSAPVSSRQMPAMLALIAPRWPAAPFSMQMHGRKTRNAGQAQHATGNLLDLSGSTPKRKSAPLKSETPHEICGQLV